MINSFHFHGSKLSWVDGTTGSSHSFFCHLGSSTFEGRGTHRQGCSDRCLASWGDGLSGWLVGWLIGWLVDWLIEEWKRMRECGWKFSVPIFCYAIFCYAICLGFTRFHRFVNIFQFVHRWAWPRNSYGSQPGAYKPGPPGPPSPQVPRMVS